MTSETNPALDFTHDAAAESWVASAQGSVDFPIQNLPMGVIECDRGCLVACAIGEDFLDLAAACDDGLLPSLDEESLRALRAVDLNQWMGLRRSQRRAVRAAIFELLCADGRARDLPDEVRRKIVRPLKSAGLVLPAAVGDYTDFYAGIHHATNVGKLFRPESPLLPNYKHVPVGYHGRSSSLVASGCDVQRPFGQIVTEPGGLPRHLKSRRLDFELELAVWITGGNALGTPIPVQEAGDAIAGYGLLNDWSARDIQTWEYQPLGPFLSKNFMTTVSPWVVSSDALTPFVTHPLVRMPEDPELQPYLHGGDGAPELPDIRFEVHLSTESMRAEGLPPYRISRSSTASLWWTPAQLVAHHTVGGCNLRPGDLFGSGTISGASPGTLGSLLEISDGGRSPLTLPSGETRTFLEAGDELVMTGHCERPGFRRIGFGACTGRVVG
jgi:fumarylacetoacetase